MESDTPTAQANHGLLYDPSLLSMAPDINGKATTGW